MRFILDAHLDLAWNAMSFDRDQTLPVETLRAREAGMTGAGRGKCTTSLPEMRRAAAGICLATLLARALPASGLQAAYAESTVGSRQRGELILREDLDFANQTICCAAAQAQLAYYRMLEYDGELRFLRTAQDVAQSAEEWRKWLQEGAAAGESAPRIGIILSMEGADPIRTVDETPKWFENGLRTACLAHYGPSAYAMGTGGDGPLTPAGVELVKEFDRLGILLDLVHTGDTAIEQALALYTRPVFVSHGNCRALVPHDRQLSDHQIRQIAARDGVIGVVLDAWMIIKDFARGGDRSQNPTLEHLALHVDHICQLTGSSRHVGIGSDLDGGFGNEQTPVEVTSFANLQQFGDILSRRGYADDTIDSIYHGNFLRFFLENLPGGSRETVA
ncbi:MAG: membrane dipeptidase [Bryobacterales bacterium]|nr:membrane dipeptidase [Bryobacterales bacterium]